MDCNRHAHDRRNIFDLLFKASQFPILGVNLHLEAHQVRRSLMKVESRILRKRPSVMPPAVAENGTAIAVRDRNKVNGRCN